MSKLDYVTIAIVAICILAIVFFVYKMTDLFGEKANPDPIEIIDEPIETEDDIYDEATDAEEDLGGDDLNGGTPSTDEDDAPSSSEEETNASDSDAEDDVASSDVELEPSETYGSTGRYMVIAGAFKLKHNARRTADRLRRLGYEHANVEIFDRGKYAVVLVDRFNNKEEADRLVGSLDEDGIKSYVKAKK